MLEVSRLSLALETFSSFRIVALGGLVDAALEGYSTASSDVPVDR